MDGNNLGAKPSGTRKSDKSLSMSVIITTYNQPKWLAKVLWGFETQSYGDFEIVIADDGSGKETQQVIEMFKERTSLNVIHVWHPDEGFRKCTILNKAILKSSGDYLVFTDGDCIPRSDFLLHHYLNAQENRFLSGGYLKLDTEVSHAITRDDIMNGNPFSIKWLLKNGQPLTLKLAKLSKSPIFTSIMNSLTTTKPTWNGHNSSGWKSDLVKVNGYNEQMQYGGLDRELGERLVNAGVQGKQIRYSAVCVHLNHPRPYRNMELILNNRAIRKHVRENKVAWASSGISIHSDDHSSR
ncbi:glycosyltransferase family 2 protein [Chitinispirillales bacterium ANBcel5]|uniref:glycosyltransferase family 2 protein n=1 Tax=Cellulosispirillum alkaliphilum TaxID=3039283 RepID=UPI002A53723C|nr:glycosyltransferase family 2 protein [Chitinispirillales bacterium ANBcel5]